MSDLIDRQAAIDAFDTEGNELIVAGKENADAVEKYLKTVMERIEELPSAQPKNENLKFLEFLWNTINPNEMEQYLEMYSSKEVKTNG